MSGDASAIRAATLRAKAVAAVRKTPEPGPAQIAAARPFAGPVSEAAKNTQAAGDTAA